MTEDVSSGTLNLAQSNPITQYSSLQYEKGRNGMPKNSVTADVKSINRLSISI